jgi:hypothetical protein
MSSTLKFSRLTGILFVISFLIPLWADVHIVWQFPYYIIQF